MSPPETGKSRSKAGRKDKPLPADGKPRTVLAGCLRGLRGACGGPTYEELAALSGVYKTGLIDAARVTRLPPWYVIEGYVAGCLKYCGGTPVTPFPGADDLSRWQQLYRDAGGTVLNQCPPQETGENDIQPGPQLGPAPDHTSEARGGPGAHSTAGRAPYPAGSRRRDRGRSRSARVSVGTAATALLVAAAVVLSIAAVRLWLLRPASASPWTRLAVQPLASEYRHPLAAIEIPAASLEPELAQRLGGRVTDGRGVTGYELRSAYPASVPLCLAAVTAGPTAGQDGGGVEVSACTPSTRSEIWIPVQYEARGSNYTWLVNDQYQSECLNADNRGGGVHQESRVQLWRCYLPKQDDFTRFNESWDFGTWLHAIQSGTAAYPLFLGAGNYSLDADDKSLQDGLPSAPVSIIDHYTVSWEYWY